MSSPSRRAFIRSESWPGIEAALALLARISRRAEVVETKFARFLDQFIELPPGLTVEPNDQRGADGHARHALTDAADQVKHLRLRHAPAHPPQDIVIKMLQRQVRIWAELRQRAVRLDELEGEVGRVRLAQAQPAQARRPGDAPEEFVDERRAGTSRAVERRVLPDQIQLARAGSDQLAGLPENLSGRPASERPRIAGMAQ
jgi:hypothetical protein